MSITVLQPTARSRVAKTTTSLCETKQLMQVFMAICLLAINACSTLPPVENSSASQGGENESTVSILPVDRTIAADMVRLARQIYPPLTTTLQFNNQSDPILEEFIEMFSFVGYGIQRVSADQGAHYFTYTKTEELSASAEPIIRFSTSIGAVGITRDYTLTGGDAVSPTSPFRLSGTRVPVKVVDTPSLRFVVSDADNSRAVYVASMNLDEQAPIISLITEDLVERVASQPLSLSSLQAINSSRMEINNLFYADQSNFTSILDDYVQTERQIIVFSDDSMILGGSNKQLIEQIIRNQFEPDDIISLVGCSNGPTDLEIGNQGLALGRAQRVTEALIEEGVPRERILDEGCWAPVSAGDKFPGRGVVLELWSKAS